MWGRGRIDSRFPRAGHPSREPGRGTRRSPCTFAGVAVDVRYPWQARTLDNGMRVVVSPSPGSGVVAVNLWYDVGSRHEDPRRQGFAHLFEHLMFQGSRHVAPGDHFALLQAQGAALNATTSFDRTNYFEAVHAGALDLALWLEADRMAYLRDVITQENFDNQVDVVGQERAQRMDDVPYGTAFELALPLVFDADHPYGHLPIGDLDHLAAAGLDEVAAFHDRFYMPANAVLTIVGDVGADDALRRADRYFGGIESAAAPERVPPEPLGPVGDVRRLDHAEDVPSPGVWLPFRLPADTADGRELAAATIASAVLGDGDTSRLYRRLVRSDRTCLDAGMGVNPLVAGNSLGMMSARLVDGGDVDAVVDSVTDVLATFAADGPTDDELTIAVAQAERSWLDEVGTAAGRADAFSACTQLFGDPDTLHSRLATITSLTADEVREAAVRWLVPMTRRQLRIEPSGAAEAADAGVEGVPA